MGKVPSWGRANAAASNGHDDIGAWAHGRMGCQIRGVCSTLSYMTILTIRLDPELDGNLRRFVERTGRSKSDFAREALRRQLAVARFEDIRRRLAPFAEARGWLTDEDVFKDIS